MARSEFKYTHTRRTETGTSGSCIVFICLFQFVYSIIVQFIYLFIFVYSILRIYGIFIPYAHQHPHLVALQLPARSSLPVPMVYYPRRTRLA